MLHVILLIVLLGLLISLFIQQNRHSSILQNSLQKLLQLSQKCLKESETNLANWEYLEKLLDKKLKEIE